MVIEEEKGLSFFISLNFTAFGQEPGRPQFSAAAASATASAAALAAKTALSAALAAASAAAEAATMSPS